LQNATPGLVPGVFSLAKPHSFTNFYRLFTGYLLGKFTHFIHGKFWVKNWTATVDKNMTDGVGLVGYHFCLNN
jgi:hypothetical protein